MKSNHPHRLKEFHSIFKSFSYAFQGIWSAFKSERNFRIHLIIVAYLAYFTRYYNFSRTDYAILISVAGLVLASELLNTAIERAVDLKSPDYNPIAKIAKDVAAGAVLMAAFAALVVGILFFGDWKIIYTIANDVVHTLYIWIPLVALSLFIAEYPVYRKKKSQSFLRDISKYKSAIQKKKKD